MARPRSDVLTDAEQRIMKVLWSRGESSVREVTQAVSAGHPVAYTTVLTLLRILSDKGYVRARQEGRGFLYTPLVSRSEARSQALRKLVSQLFEGSPTALAQHLIRTESLSAEEVAAIRAELEASGDPAAEVSRPNVRSRTRSRRRSMPTAKTPSKKG